jgi:ATP-dependent helicase HrpB
MRTRPTTHWRPVAGWGSTRRGHGRWDRYSTQFLKIAEKEGLDVSEQRLDGTAVRKCVLAGFSDQLAKRLDGGTLRCELVHGRRGLLARESCMQKAPLLVAAEISEIEGRGGEVNVLLSLATAVEESWLKEIFPG